MYLSLSDTEHVQTITKSARAIFVFKLLKAFETKHTSLDICILRGPSTVFTRVTLHRVMPNQNPDQTPFIIRTRRSPKPCK